jgi:carbon monoxide dehydrogenase subunit G
MPYYSHTLEIDAPPEKVFAVLADVSRTPEWLERCTQVEVLSPGEPNVGQKLRYHYTSGRMSGSMDGVVAAYAPKRHLTLLYTDAMMDVTVAFRVDPADDGRTRLTHNINIRTKLLGRLFTPLIARQLPEQTVSSMNRLKELVERG